MAKLRPESQPISLRREVSQNEEEVLKPEETAIIDEEPEEEIRTGPFWIKDEVSISIYALLNSGGELVSFSLSPLSEVQRDVLGYTETEIKASFTIPSSSEIEDYRIKATLYNAESRQMMLQRPLLRRLLVLNHLRSLDIPGVDLQHDKRNRLTDESEEILDKLHPSIIDLLILKFQDKMALVI